MSDLYRQALCQALLGTPGSGSSELESLIAEVCRRIILSGISFNSSGVMSLGIPSFGPSVIANLGTGVIGDVPYFDSTTTLARLAGVASGNVLLSSGVGAAPAYGKVANSQVDAAAAIAYSKLALATSIVNGDVALAAAIAYSKLNLALSIVNADINAAAAIAWSKLDKTGSSLADLTTKSAASLTSGLLPDARLPGYTSDGASKITQLAFLAAQSASADLNTLDDYEEGSWTPAIVSSGGGAPTYTNRIALYTKIGRYVYVNGRIDLATLGTLAAGNLTISGLPFTSETTANPYNAVTFGWWSAITAAIQINGYVQPNSTSILVQHIAAAVASPVQMTVAQLTGTSGFIFSASYLAIN